MGQQENVAVIALSKFCLKFYKNYFTYKFGLREVVLYFVRFEKKTKLSIYAFITSVILFKQRFIYNKS